MDGLADVAERAFAVSLIGEGTDFSGLVTGVDAGLDVGGVGGEGLFAKDMETLGEGADDLFFVEGVGAGDDDGIEFFFFEHFGIVGVGGEFAEFGEASLEAGDLGAVGIGEGGDADIVAGEKTVGVDAHDAATANESDSEYPYHYQLLPCFGR